MKQRKVIWNGDDDSRDNELIPMNYDSNNENIHKQRSEIGLLRAYFALVYMVYVSQ